jgi:tetratricopeptide (TPR) repeat protein
MRALYSLAQLQMVVADYPAAVTTLERWFGLQRNPAPAARALAGTAYAQVQRYPEAVEQLSAAIEQADRPQENWYRQLLAVRYQARQYTAAAELLQRMILLFPERKDYWLQLSGVYAETGNQTQSVAVLELAYLQGVLTEERDLLNLAQHYLYTGLAHKAGQLLERSLRDGTVTATRENWALLVDAWLHARETDRALGAVERALESVAHADLHLRHAQLLADKEDWSEVVRATELALAGDALTRRGTAHLLAGVAHFHLQHPREARSCFERAREFDRSRHQAEQWLQHLATSQLYAGSHSPQRLSP